MKTMKRITASLLSTALLLSLAACSGKAPSSVVSSEGQTSSSSPEAVEGVSAYMYPTNKKWDIRIPKYEKAVGITMWIPNSATSSMGKGIQSLADAFNEEQKKNHPDKNIAVTVEFQDKSSALNEKLQASILSGNNPVISAVGVSSVPLYEAKSLDLRNVFSYEELQAQNQGLMQYSMYDGKFILNPYFPSASNILIANKTLFDKKNITLPKAEDIIADPAASTWTWDTFKTMTKAVTDTAAGVYGFATNALDPIGMMVQQGGYLYNQTVSEIMFKDDPRFANGLTFWRSLVTDGSMLDPNSRANHNSIIVSEFYEQKVGMIYTTSSNIAKFTEEAKKNNYEIAVLPFPKEKQFYTNQGGSGILILDNRPDEEINAAAEFLRWLNLPQNNAKICAVSGYLPLSDAAMAQPELAAVYGTTPLMKTAAELMKFGVTSPQGKAKAACDKAVNDYSKKIWSEPNTSIDDIVKQVVDKVQYEMEANK